MNKFAVGKIKHIMHNRTDNRLRAIYRVTCVGLIVNLVLAAGKLVAGLVGRSGAMIADAVHSISDLITDVVVLVFAKLSAKPQDATHPFGYGKYETLATVIISLFLGFVGAGILWDSARAILRAVQGELLPRPGLIALIAAVVSIVVKELLYRYTVREGQRLDSSSVVANAWHHRSDALTSVATLIGIGGALLLGPHWSVLDPLAAVVVSGFIVKAAFSLMKPGIDELLEKSLPEDQIAEIASIIGSVPGVIAFHRLRTRRIGANIAIDTHVKMDGGISLRNAHEIASEIESLLKKKYGAATYIGIHMEPFKG